MGHRFFRVRGEERGERLGILRCNGGVGVGHTRKTEKIKEKMNIAKEEGDHGYRRERRSRLSEHDREAAEAETKRHTDTHTH